MPRQTYYRTHSHPTTTSERRAQRNRERDPSWVARPPNAFIIFRAEYSRKHAQANRNCAPTLEKTLSKRAGEAWSALSSQEKEPYKQRAEKERLEHAEKHPHYRYKPRRRQCGGEKGPATLSRREQVESLVRRAAIRSKSLSSESESTSGYTSPSSPASVDYSSPSPEPLETPFRDDSPAAPVRHGGRSISMPSRPDAPLQRRCQQSLLLSANSGASVYPQWSSEVSDVKPDLSSLQWSGALPDVKLDLSGESSSPHGEGSPFSWPIEPLDAGFQLWTGGQSAGAAPPPSAPPSLQSNPNTFTLESSCVPSQGVEIPHAVRPPTPTQTATSASPLLRRRRAATASGAFPSPLTVVSSSLANWSTMPVPAVTVTGASPTTESSGAASVAASTYPPPVRYMQSWPTEAFTPPDAPPAPVGEIDFDRTPTSSEFPASAHAQVVPPITGMADWPFDSAGDVSARQETRPAAVGIHSYSDFQTDFESYTMGLAELGIEPGAYSTPPFGELDINEFLNFDADVAVQR
ncbi:hypothetical protein DAEQUDRAFT_734921 [Daedalea quercina L-15889]|uniref:HMG box domain-containing protein n=1 Tax=Daedalea quercina L-15889 TaxID=1314783 RepID=A0A165TWN7_9APHY|nr:hypothetical protein DAEQUDRAFT_734921 [Daedalea quercina L-15889]